MVMRSALLASCFVSVASKQKNPPAWPSNVKIFGPDDQNITEEAAELMGRGGPDDLNNVTTGHYSDKRLALLFKPGNYSNVSIPVGYYTQVLGLGLRADDVAFVDTVMGVHCVNPAPGDNPGSLDTFWRGAENFRSEASNGTFWAVSQAAPLRRVHVMGNLSLHDGEGWASGGFMANCKVEGETLMGTQQQWITRNSDLQTKDRNVMGGDWNLVFVGTTGAPPPRYLDGMDESVAITNIAATPVIAEKPFITIDDDGLYTLQVPPVRRLAVGSDLNDVISNLGFTSISFDNVSVVTASSTDEELQSILEDGLHLVLSPGIYYLNKSLTLKKDGQVLLGIGMATLVAPHDGSPCVQVEAKVKGVRVAGLMLQASSIPANAQSTSTLLQWGKPNSKDRGSASDPGVMSDIFMRVGGPDLDRDDISVDTMLAIHSDHVIGDNLWLWRADHALRQPDEPFQNFPWDEGADEKAKEYHIVVDGEYEVNTGLSVKGDYVTIYGLFVEHTLGHMTRWSGEAGQVFFYQSEFPYDMTQESYCGKNFSSYMVEANVRSHQAFGLGAYSYFRDHDCIVENGFQSPLGDGIRLTNMFSRYLNGKGGIKHVINGRGSLVKKQDPWAPTSRIYSSKLGECPGDGCPPAPVQKPSLLCRSFPCNRCLKKHDQSKRKGLGAVTEV